MLVFISYAHEDSELVDRICQRVEKAGMRPYRDTKNILWGGRISSEVRQALDEAGRVIVVVSPASVKSQWVAYEVGYTVALRKAVLPFLTHPSIDLPGFLSDLRCITVLDEIGTFLAQDIAAGQAEVVRNSGGASEAARTAHIVSELSSQMSDILAEMKQDIRSDETGLVMELVILRNRKMLFVHSKKRFVYYESEIPDLRLKIDRLEEYHLVRPVKTEKYGGQIYRMAPEFVAALRS